MLGDCNRCTRIDSHRLSLPWLSSIIFRAYKAWNIIKSSGSIVMNWETARWLRKEIPSNCTKQVAILYTAFISLRITFIYLTGSSYSENIPDITNLTIPWNLAKFKQWCCQGLVWCFRLIRSRSTTSKQIWKILSVIYLAMIYWWFYTHFVLRIQPALNDRAQTIVLQQYDLGWNPSRATLV